MHLKIVSDWLYAHQWLFTLVALSVAIVGGLVKGWDYLQKKRREGRIKKYVRFFKEDFAQKRAKLVAAGAHFNNLAYLSTPTAAPGEDPDEVKEAWERYRKFSGGNIPVLSAFRN
jgi:hypothetical protein